MSSSTFSRLRVGKKTYFAGVPVLVAKVSGAAVAASVGVIPKNSIILSAVASENNVDATVTDGTTTVTLNTTTAHVSVDSGNVDVIAGLGTIAITAAATGAFLLISYILVDDANGANG